MTWTAVPPQFGKPTPIFLDVELYGASRLQPSSIGDQGSLPRKELHDDPELQ